MTVRVGRPVEGPVRGRRFVGVVSWTVGGSLEDPVGGRLCTMKWSVAVGACGGRRCDFSDSGLV